MLSSCRLKPDGSTRVLTELYRLSVFVAQAFEAVPNPKVGGPVVSAESPKAFETIDWPVPNPEQPGATTDKTSTGCQPACEAFTCPYRTRDCDQCAFTPRALISGQAETSGSAALARPGFLCRMRVLLAWIEEAAGTAAEQHHQDALSGISATRMRTHQL